MVRQSPRPEHTTPPKKGAGHVTMGNGQSTAQAPGFLQLGSWHCSPFSQMELPQAGRAVRGQ